jgi:hypothetical protein
MTRAHQAIIACCVAMLIAALDSRVAPLAAETIDVSDSRGGSVAENDGRWAGLAARGLSVRIVGPCQSACTVLLRHIPRSRICVTPQASFGFHLSRQSDETAKLWNGYQDDIRAWINQHGGLQQEFIRLGAPEIFRFFRRCPA